LHQLPRFSNRRPQDGNGSRWPPWFFGFLGMRLLERSTCEGFPSDRSVLQRFGSVRLGATYTKYDSPASPRAPRLRHFSSRTYSPLQKEVIQPQVPLRLPCYDFAPVIKLAFGRCLLAVGSRTSGAPNFHGVTGGVYKARERIHRGVADPRLLAIPASCSRVADCNPNLDRVSPIGSPSRVRSGLSRPL
jgi:hypothetical protein